MPKETIQDAQNSFISQGEKAIDEEYRNLVEVVRQRKLKVEIPNFDFKHALFLNKNMFDDTKYSIYMFNGDSEGWLDVLKDSLDNAVQRIRSNKAGSLKAIIIGDKIPDVLSNLSEQYGKNVVDTVLASAEKPDAIKHFVICDSRMTRVEQPHAPLNSDSPADSIKADVSFDNRTKAKEYEARFEAYWKYLKK